VEGKERKRTLETSSPFCLEEGKRQKREGGGVEVSYISRTLREGKREKRFEGGKMGGGEKRRKEGILFLSPPPPQQKKEKRLIGKKKEKRKDMGEIGVADRSRKKKKGFWVQREKKKGG